jgi:hypothetical protein
LPISPTEPGGLYRHQTRRRHDLETLRLEAERHGVQLSVFCPGAIRTSALTGGKFRRIPGISDEELLKSWERLRPMAPEKFAEHALRAVLRGEAIIAVPPWWTARHGGRRCGTWSGCRQRCRWVIAPPGMQ